LPASTTPGTPARRLAGARRGVCFHNMVPPREPYLCGHSAQSPTHYGTQTALPAPATCSIGTISCEGSAP
jgi:hypothetical protein